MEAHDVRQFVQRYFRAYNCTVHEKKDGLLEVELSEEVDRKIMNRPFYWHYMKAMNKKGVPQTLRLRVDQASNEPGVESIHFGSRRFQQLMDDLTNKQHIVQAYEYVNTPVQTALYPWLIMNIKISYNGMQSKDEIFSLGLQLITGKIVVNMMEHLQNMRIQSNISPMCYLLSPMITYASGCKRIERILDVYLEEQQHAWAIRSIEALDEELLLIDTFYVEDTEEKRKEINMVKKRYQPQIIFTIMSGGVVFLSENFHH